MTTVRDGTSDQGVSLAWLLTLTLTKLRHSVSACSLRSTGFPVLSFDVPIATRHGRFYCSRWISVALGVTPAAKGKVIEIAVGTLMLSSVHCLSIMVQLGRNIAISVIQHRKTGQFDRSDA